MSSDSLSHLMEIICRIGGVQSLSPEQDIYDAGVSSVNALPLLMEFEDRFKISIPDEKFLEASTPAALQKLVSELQKETSAS